MKLDKVIKDLEGMKKAGFVTCNIQCFLDQLEKVASDKVVVPQYVADWYEQYKDDLDYSIWNVITSKAKLTRKEATIKAWIDDTEDAIIILVKMHLFGYKIEEEKKYTVRVKGVDGYTTHLNKNLDNGAWFFASDTEIKGFRVEHTKYELEEGGFGEVFNSPLFEVKEKK